MKVRRDLIKYKLLEMNMTQKEFSDKIKISRVTFSNALHGVGSYKLFNKIADGLGVPVTKIIEIED